MTISKTQWEKIQETLSGFLFDPVEFRMPSGEVIAVHKRFISENRTAIFVWIDSQRDPIWGNPYFEEFRPIVKQVWHRSTFKPGAKIIRKIAKEKGGEKLLKRKEYRHLHEVKEYWNYHFPTASTLVSQFRKIDGLELVTEVNGEE